MKRKEMLEIMREAHEEHLMYSGDEDPPYASILFAMEKAGMLPPSYYKKYPADNFGPAWEDWVFEWEPRDEEESDETGS